LRPTIRCSIINQVIIIRRLVAIVCIAAILVTGIMPGGVAFARDVLVPLGPLFGTVVSTPLPLAADVYLPAAPVLPVRAARPPPLA
jgi:hypothetical protein